MSWSRIAIWIMQFSICAFTLLDHVSSSCYLILRDSVSINIHQHSVPTADQGHTWHYRRLPFRDHFETATIQIILSLSVSFREFGKVFLGPNIIHTSDLSTYEHLPLHQHKQWSQRPSKRHQTPLIFIKRTPPSSSQPPPHPPPFESQNPTPSTPEDSTRNPNPSHHVSHKTSNSMTHRELELAVILTYIFIILAILYGAIPIVDRLTIIVLVGFLLGAILHADEFEKENQALETQLRG